MRNRVAAILLIVITMLTGLVWTGQAGAQADVRRVGILTFSAANVDPTLDAVLQVFIRTLADQGWIDGKNVAFEYRSAHSDPSQFATAANELVALKVDAILAGSAPAVRAAFAATREIPIVANDFTTDPVAEGYVISHARPGGNVTGVFLDAPEFAGKWFELLKAMVADLSRVAVLWDPAPGATHLEAVRGVADSLDIKLQILEVRTPSDIEKAFDELRDQPQAIIFLPSPMIYGQSEQLARLALAHRLPATSMAREFANEEGLLSYGPERAFSWMRSATLVGKILSGANPAELPVERPTKVELVVNLKTAKALGITIPQSILLRADEVIR